MSALTSNFPIFDIKGDPRQSSTATNPSIEPVSSDLASIDMYQTLGLIGSGVTVFMKNPLVGWASLFCCLVSYARRKVSTSTSSHPLQTMLFCTVALAMVYNNAV
ncbi:hypothetical protein BC828DRAFT_374287 [Blastocladiella britannica]|nr:hypothetical protein BC828DRAFT_374287 [Blastocladiella britannica]